MKHIKTLSLVLLLITQFNLSAKEVKADPDPPRRNVGFGIGAIIGGLLAGPPGAIVSAASGMKIVKLACLTAREELTYRLISEA